MNIFSSQFANLVCNFWEIKQIYINCVFTFSNGTDEEDEEEEMMNISQEILVLDFGDEKNSDFLRSEGAADFGKGLYQIIKEY